MTTNKLQDVPPAYGAGQAASGKRSLLLVHGRDFKPTQEAWQDMSFAAMRAGVNRDFAEHIDAFDAINKEAAYYGDLTNEYLESQGLSYDEQLDLGDRTSCLAALRAIPVRKRFSLRQYDRLPGKSAVREFVADVVAPVAGSVGLLMPLVSAVSKDTFEYLCGDGDYANKVRARVRTRLQELLDRGDRVMIAAHGTGCLVTYEVLWELSHEPEFKTCYGDKKIDMWITLGAPLGDNHIRKFLKGAQSESENRFPTNVITWHNVASEDDYTCHDNTLADDFKKMLRHRNVSAVHDHKIYNLAVRYGKSNPHSSLGYFIHPRMAKLIVDWIQADRLSDQPIYTI
jgi:hypothetical protein